MTRCVAGLPAVWFGVATRRASPPATQFPDFDHKELRRPTSPPAPLPAVEPLRQSADPQKQLGHQTAGGRADQHIAQVVGAADDPLTTDQNGQEREQQPALGIKPDQGGRETGGRGRVGRREALARIAGAQAEKQCPKVDQTVPVSVDP